MDLQGQQHQVSVAEIKTGEVRVAEDTVVRYSHREGNVNLVLLRIWSDKTKGERLGNWDQHTVLTDLHVCKPKNATNHSKQIYLNLTKSSPWIVVLLQQDLRQEAPMMLLNATAYSLLKFVLPHW